MLSVFLRVVDFLNDVEDYCRVNDIRVYRNDIVTWLALGETFSTAHVMPDCYDRADEDTIILSIYRQDFPENSENQAAVTACAQAILRDIKLEQDIADLIRGMESGYEDSNHYDFHQHGFDLGGKTYCYDSEGLTAAVEDMNLHSEYRYEPVMARWLLDRAKRNEEFWRGLFDEISVRLETAEAGTVNEDFSLKEYRPSFRGLSDYMRKQSLYFIYAGVD